jgi:hypothetical protein
MGGSAEAGANEGKNAEQYRNGAALRFLFEEFLNN